VIDREFKVEGAAKIEARIASGRIEFRPGQADWVRVEAVSKSGDLRVEQRGETIVIATERSGFLSSGRAEVVVTLPEGSDLTVGVASADVICTLPVGRLEINTASGDVRFTDAEDVRIKTASGDVSGDSAGAISFVSASGDIRLGHAGRRSELSTASGNVQIEEASGKVKSSTMSGDLGIRRLSGDVLEAKAMSGDVRIGIPAGTTLDLSANTLSGSIRLPERSSEDVEPIGHAAVRVKLVSGDLTIKRV
jgi:DUF4097 and DUF4098 domain-containing protein YvlB